MRWLLFVVLVVCSGCGSKISAVRTGPKLPALASDCQVELLNVGVKTAEEGLETIGQALVDGSGAKLTMEERAKLNAHACRLGARYLVPTASVGKVNAFLITRLRKGYVVHGGQVVKAKPDVDQPAASQPAASQPAS